MFHGFCSYVLRHLRPVHEVNVYFHSIRFKQKITFPYLALNAVLGASKTANRTNSRIGVPAALPMRKHDKMTCLVIFKFITWKQTGTKY